MNSMAHRQHQMEEEYASNRKRKKVVCIMLILYTLNVVYG